MARGGRGRRFVVARTCSVAPLPAEKIDTLKLITEVECRPRLWKGSTKSSCSREGKRRDWNRVAAAVSSSWKKASASQRNKIVTQLKKKWSSLRDYHTRTRNAKEMSEEDNSAPRKRKMYIHSNLLRFLDNVPRRRKKSRFASVNDDNPSKKNVDEAAERCDESDREELRNVSEEINSETSETVENCSKKAGINDFQREVLNLLRERRSNKRKRDEDMDADKMFLLSFLPSMRKMDEIQKMDFKYQITNSLRNVRFP